MRAILTLIGDGTGRIGYILPGYRPSFRIGEKQCDCVMSDFDILYPGHTHPYMKIDFMTPYGQDIFSKLKIGDKFTITEGLRVVANGTVIEI